MCTRSRLVRGEPAHYHFDVRFLVRAEHDRFTVSEESHSLAWVPANGLGALTGDESVLRMARKWLARRGDETRSEKPGPVPQRRRFTRLL